MNDNKRIDCPPMCERHRSELIHGAKFKMGDPWMALEVVSQLALVQATLADKKYLIKYSNDPMGINRVGCLACFSPKIFKEIIDVAKKTRDIGEVKKIGERFDTLNSSPEKVPLDTPDPAPLKKTEVD